MEALIDIRGGHDRRWFFSSLLQLAARDKRDIYSVTITFDYLLRVEPNAVHARCMWLRVRGNGRNIVCAAYCVFPAYCSAACMHAQTK